MKQRSRWPGHRHVRSSPLQHLPFPDRKYSLILADYPWEYNDRKLVRNDGTGAKFGYGAANHYNVMTLDDLCDFPIWELAADNCAIVLWETAPLAPEAMRVAHSICEKGGFRYATKPFSWLKTTKTGKPWFGVGYYAKCLAGDTQVFVLRDGVVRSTTVRELMIDGYVGAKIHTPSGWRDISSMSINLGTPTVTFKTTVSSLTTSMDHRSFFKRIFRPRIDLEKPKRSHEHRIDCDTAEHIRDLWKKKAVRARDSINLLACTHPVHPTDPIGVIGSIAASEETGWLAGLFAAEGNYQKNQVRFTLHSKETSFVDRITRIVDSLGLNGDRFFNLPIQAHHHFTKGVQSVSVYFSSKVVRDFIGQILTGIGSHGKRLNLPLLFNTPVEFRLAFIKGMCDGDGFLEHGKYQRVTLCNKGLVEDLHHLCLSVGIPTLVRKGSTTYLNNKRRDCWTLAFLGYRRCKVNNPFIGMEAIRPVQMLDVHDGEAQTTYELSVDGHVFVANGLVTHNSNIEDTLMLVRGTLPIMDNSISSVVEAPHYRYPPGQDAGRPGAIVHSAKPVEVAKRLVRLFGDVPRIEMFARVFPWQNWPTPMAMGWDAWGDEIPYGFQDAQPRCSLPDGGRLRRGRPLLCLLRSAASSRHIVL